MLIIQGLCSSGSTRPPAVRGTRPPLQLPFQLRVVILSPKVAPDHEGKLGSTVVVRGIASPKKIRTNLTSVPEHGRPLEGGGRFLLSL